MDNHSHLDWGDLGAFAALAEAGSTVAAGVRLGVSHQTIARRVGNLESALGLNLVVRDRHPWQLTQDGELIAASVRAISGEVDWLVIAGRRRETGMRGTVRVASVSWAFELVILPALQALQQEYPHLSFDLIADDKPNDVEKGDADLALRITDVPPPNLIGRRLGIVTFGLYGQPSQIEQFDRTGDVDRAIELLNAPKHRPAVNDLSLPIRLTAKVGDFSTLVASARHGLGVAILPDLVGSVLPDLSRSRRLALPTSDLAVWLLKASNSRISARVKATETAMAGRVRDLMRPLPKRRQHDNQ